MPNQYKAEKLKSLMAEYEDIERAYREKTDEIQEKIRVILGAEKATPRYSNGELYLEFFNRGHKNYYYPEEENLESGIVEYFKNEGHVKIYEMSKKFIELSMKPNFERPSDPLQQAAFIDVYINIHNTQLCQVFFNKRVRWFFPV